jgi:hypothetical protein
MKPKSLNCKTVNTDDFKLSEFIGCFIVALNTYMYKETSRTTILFRR